MEAVEPVLVNIAKELGASRYNGGWTKSVTGLDKTRDNGYSIVGEFVGTGVRPVQPGLYLDCNIDGSRKNQTKHYTLCEVFDDGSVAEVEQVAGTSGYDRGKTGHDWAVRLWPAIDAWFAARASGPTREELSAKAQALRAQLAELESTLQS